MIFDFNVNMTPCAKLCTSVFSLFAGSFIAWSEFMTMDSYMMTLKNMTRDERSRVVSAYIGYGMPLPFNLIGGIYTLFAFIAIIIVIVKERKGIYEQKQQNESEKISMLEEKLLI